MENREEKQNNDIVEGKITTFASPTVLAAILDEQILDEGAVPSKVDHNDERQNSGMVADSLDVSLNDSLDSTKLQESGEVIGDVVDTEELIGKDHTVSPLGFPERVVDYPKSSTPAQNENPVDEKSKNAEKAPKPRRPQHIIERNKEQVGKRASQRASYAQMHAIKTRNKLSKDKEKKANVEGDQNLDNTPGFNSESKLDSVERNFNQNPNFPSDHVDQIPHGDTMSNSSADLQQNESYLLENSYPNGTHDIFQNHGPYYDVSQNSRLYDSTHQSSYFDQTGTYSRGYGSAMGYLSQKPVPPLYHQSLSTQSAPPGVYGYERKPLINSLHTSNFSEEGYYQSTVLPHNESDKGFKIPESSLHRKFSSDPYLAQSRSTSLQNIANVGRNSKASGSYSNLRQPFEYKPYTLKDYQNLAGSKAKPLAGGLGPNVDTDDFKEKVKALNCWSTFLELSPILSRSSY